MNNRRLSLLVCLTFLLPWGIVPTLIGAENRAPAFSPGERLTYQLRWGIIIAGTAVLEVHPLTDVNGETARHFSLTIRTSPLMDRFYKVRDRIDGFARKDFQGSLLYLVKKEEGRHLRDVQVTFNLESGTAQYVNFGEEREPIEIPPSSLDPLSVLFAFRQTDLNGGAQVEFPITDGRRAAFGIGRIGPEERVIVPAGTFRAFVLEPDMREVEGVFERRKGASIRMWFSSDEKRIPVRMQSRVPVGSFRAELVSIEQIDPADGR